MWLLMDEARVPRHIAIIMDGNGRWATARGLPRIMGHQAGAQAVRRIVEASCELGVSVLTLYAFSWENWDRPTDEIQELMGLLDEFVQREASTLLANRIRLRAIGRFEEIPPAVFHLKVTVDVVIFVPETGLVMAGTSNVLLSDLVL